MSSKQAYDKKEYEELITKFMKEIRHPTSDGEFTLVTSDYYTECAEFPWIMESILPATGLASIFGPSGSGKSFICLDLAAAVAQGTNWFGHKTISTPVVYIPLEGETGLTHRLQAWEKHHQTKYPAWVRFLPESYSLMAEDDIHERLAHLIKRKWGYRNSLIIIDTLNQATLGLDENSSAQMGSIIEKVKKLQELTEGLVLLVHHTGKKTKNGLRGHSSLHAALDTVIEINESSKKLNWELIKSKNGIEGIGYKFALQIIELGNNTFGNPITSCVIQEGEKATAKGKSKVRTPIGKNRVRALDGFRKLLSEQPSSHTDTFAGLEERFVIENLKDLFKDAGPKHQVSNTKNAINGLINKGFIIKSKEGNLLLPD